MHCYATDSSEKRFVPIIVGGLSIAAAFGLSKIVTALNITALWWIDVPSVMGFYGIFLTVFDQWIWRYPILRHIGLIKTPNLNGIWEGNISSSFENHEVRHQASLQITQTWTQMRVILQTEHSRSHSLSASLITVNPADINLSYEYFNEPRSSAATTMAPHRGAASLVLRQGEGSRILDGDYYSGRGRGNHGTLSFKEEQIT
jgi:SMODS-associating 2TM, beta-strand rich effector domain